MTHTKLLAAMALATLLAACNKTQPAVDNTPRLIELGAEGENINASVATRTAEVTTLDAFNLSVTKGTTNNEQTVWNNAPFTASNSNGSIVFTGGKYWPAENMSYHFYASNVAMNEATPAGVTLTATNDTDIVCALKMTPSYRDKTSLVFEHIFARLGDVVVTPADGYTISNVQVSISPKTGGTYNIKTGTGVNDDQGWSNVTTGSAVQIANSTCPSTKSNDIYLVPGTYTLTASWQANINEYQRIYTNKTVDVCLDKGKVNTINATLGGDATDIKFSVAVSAWRNSSVNTTFPVY